MEDFKKVAFWGLVLAVAVPVLYLLVLLLAWPLGCVRYEHPTDHWVKGIVQVCHD